MTATFPDLPPGTVPPRENAPTRGQPKPYPLEDAPAAGWVPVGERLPGTGFYLVLLPAPSHMEGRSVAYFTADGLWQIARQLVSPTHWMPLPQPPQRPRTRGEEVLDRLATCPQPSQYVSVRSADLVAAIDKAIAEEREACAKLADARRATADGDDFGCCLGMASAIRDRK